MALRKQQEIELEAALHGIKLKKTGIMRRKGKDLDRQLAAGRMKGYRIRTGVRGQPPKKA